MVLLARTTSREIYRLVQDAPSQEGAQLELYDTHCSITQPYQIMRQQKGWK